VQCTHAPERTSTHARTRARAHEAWHPPRNASPTHKTLAHAHATHTHSACVRACTHRLSRPELMGRGEQFGDGFGDLMKKWFLFSLIWSVGGNLDTNRRRPHPPATGRTSLIVIASLCPAVDSCYGSDRHLRCMTRTGILDMQDDDQSPLKLRWSLFLVLYLIFAHVGQQGHLLGVCPQRPRSHRCPAARARFVHGAPAT
jgi:hypothetical protein